MPEVSFRQLKQIPLFTELGKDDLKAVAELAQREEYPAGREICRQGQVGLTAYFVESGELRVLHIDPQGIEQEVARLGPGDYFGETSLLLGEPRDATVEVVQDATLLYLNKDKLDQLLYERPSVLDTLQMRADVARKLRAPRFKWQDPDEVVVVRLRKHDMILIRQLVFPALALWLGLMGCLYWIRHPGGILAVGMGVVGVLFALASLPFVVYLVVDYRNDNYIVTNKRVVHEERVPLLRESRAEAPLRTIQDIQQSQEGLLAHYYNFGDLVIETAGERGQVIFRQIPNPTETRDAIFEQIHRVRSRARAEERAAIREAMGHQFGFQPPEEQAAAPSPPPKKRRLKLQIPAWVTASLRALTFFVPPLRHEQGDTVTWRKHWIALIRPIWLPTLLIGIITLIAIWALFLSPGNLIPILIGYGTLMVFLLPWWIWKFDDWQNDIYQVTATRIIDIERLPFHLREERREASLDKIQNTSLEIPGIWGKLLNYGSVTIETAGTEPFTFAYVKDPRGVQTEIARRVEAFQSLLRRQEAERRRAELLDWFSVYDQIRSSTPPADQSPSPHQQES
jgi:CRP-like cAMP-binding protein